jgi:hypothetical protein
MTLFLLTLVQVAASPVAPWWAAPHIVSAIEHVATGLLVFMGLMVQPMFTVYQGRKTRSRVDEKRAESSAEHGQTINRIEGVMAEVRTGNALKLGQLADAGETRRIEKKRPGDRTDEERAHLDAVPPKD